MVTGGVPCSLRPDVIFSSATRFDLANESCAIVGKRLASGLHDGGAWDMHTVEIPLDGAEPRESNEGNAPMARPAQIRKAVFNCD